MLQFSRERLHVDFNLAAMLTTDFTHSRSHYALILMLN